MPTTYGTTGDTWYVWCDNGTAATATATWTYWSSSTVSNVSYAPYRAPAETDEQREARETAQAERVAEAQAAVARAEELLLANLSRRQRTEYRRCQQFHVRGPSGCRYRIERKRVANIVLLHRDGSPSERLCVHPIEGVPDEDTMLAQKLWIEGGMENELVGLANRRAA